MRRCVSALASAGLVAVALALAAGAAAPAAPKPPSGAELAALAQPPVRTSLASQRVYFVLTDRYANGDPTNDRGGLTGPRGITGYDPADTGYFHGGDFKGLTGDCGGTTGLARIKELGFTAVWVTPPFGQRSVQGGSAAYHGYWIQDFTSVDPHLGTNAEFGAFAACAHSLGLKVYLDVVVNHTADVIGLTGSGFLEPGEAPYRDCKGKTFLASRYGGGKTFPCLSVANMPRVPVVLPSQRHAKQPEWLNDPRRYHDRGDIDFGSCSELCFEQGDFYGLDDLFTEQPAVVNGLAGIYGDWIRRYKIDGFRVDTARHVDRAFFKVWVPKIRAAARAAGVADFELFGEVFLNDSIGLVPFVRERRIPNLLDFPLQDATVGYAAGEAGALGIANRLDDDDYFRLGDGVAPTPPTFLGNHDLGRVATLLRSRSGATGPQLLARDLLAHDLLYLLRGAPVVYYGDEVGMTGNGGDKAARQDMFATKVADWRAEERVGGTPVGSGSSFAVSNPIAARLKVLAALRDAHPALAIGATAVRYAKQKVLVVSRFDAAARREYVVAFNAGSTATTVTVVTATPGSAWTGLLGAGAASAADGKLTLTVPAVGSRLLRAGTDLPVTPAATPTLAVKRDDLTDMWRVTGGATGVVSVAFALRRTGETGWRRLAADDSPPYRAFVDPKGFRRKERVHVVAVVRSLDGSAAVSRVVSFVPR